LIIRFQVWRNSYPGFRDLNWQSERNYGLLLFGLFRGIDPAALSYCIFGVDTPHLILKIDFFDIDLMGLIIKTNNKLFIIHLNFFFFFFFFFLFNSFLIIQYELFIEFNLWINFNSWKIICRTSPFQFFILLFSSWD